MEDIFQQKDVPWPSDNMSEDRFEFRDLEVDFGALHPFRSLRLLCRQLHST